PTPAAITTPLAAALLIAAAFAAPAFARATSAVRPALAPPANPLLERILQDDLTEPAERAALRVFHGQWPQHALQTPWQLRAPLATDAALARWRLDDPALTAPSAPPLVAAAALLRIGNPEAAIARITDAALVDPAADAATVDDLAARLILADAHEQTNNLVDAIAALEPVRILLQRERLNDAPALTHAARALLRLARLQGRPGDDYRLALDLLGRARDADPLYWPAQLTEGTLLAEKDNRAAGGEALLEVLALNPTASDAWHRLGRLSVEAFDFDRAASAAATLEAIAPGHPLAAIVRARSALHQKDAAAAQAALDALLARYPTHREALALRAAAAALAYDDGALSQALATLDALAPGTPIGHLEAGLALSQARQYGPAADHLLQAIDRQPNDAAPRVALGLLHMQAGTLDDAHRELTIATRLDPFNRFARNSLTLVADLLTWDTLETDHFVIRYRPGIDAALAHDLPDILEDAYATVTQRFDHEPAVKTQIDLLPDERYFGVRIAGLPEIWTIAAATGPVIALTPPREGANQRGTFDVANVLLHEFVHTVTLSQTNNRLPHWFTEACAVYLEKTGRTFDTKRLLADALHNDNLFAYDRINWGFVRPESPTDRPLAYAQACWMLDYIDERFGWPTVLDMLDGYATGRPDAQILLETTGLTVDEFMSDFRAWAQTQAAAWGMAQGDDLDTAPGNPGTLLAQATAATQGGDLDAAIAALTELDRVEPSTGAFAHQLAQLHAQRADHPAALTAAERALHREPYNATFRTTAATAALRANEPQTALRHLRALSILEPTDALHFVRLAALHDRLGNPDAARDAAGRAKQIDPDAPVDRWLGETD
ncbi:MAG: tetratricopeptide repeat protein, partial [Planctomycetota bacterium]